MNNEPEKVVQFYVACNKLKDLIRSGWKDVWHVKRERLESVAEHIYGVQMLAIAMTLELVNRDPCIELKAKAQC